MRLRRGGFGNAAAVFAPPVEAPTGGTFTGNPSISGTRGGTMTATNATFTGTDTRTGQWYYDNVATGDTDTSFNDSDTTKTLEYRNALVTSGEVVSAYIGAVVAAPIYAQNFDAYSDGTLLRSVPGWSYVGDAAYQDNYQIIDGEIRTTISGREAEDRYVYDLGASSYLFEAAFYWPENGSFGFSLWPDLFLLGNYAHITAQMSTRVGGYLGGDYHALPDFPAEMQTAGKHTLGIMIDNAVDKAFFTLDGELYGDAAGYEMTSPPTTTTMALVQNSASRQPVGYMMWDDIVVRSLASAFVRSSEIVPRDVPTQAGRKKLVVTYSNPGVSATDTQYRIERESGEMLAGWTNIGGLSGTFEWIIPDFLYEGEKLVIKVRAVGGTVSVFSILSPINPYDVPINATIPGMNGSSTYTLIGPRNRADQGDLRVYGSWSGAKNVLSTDSPGYSTGEEYIPCSEVGMSYDGIAHQYPAGGTSFRKYFSVVSRPGLYEITYPAGMTASIVPQGADTAVTVAPSGGVARVTVSSPGTDAGFWMDFEGTPVPFNFRPEMYLVSDTDRTKPFDPASITSWGDVLHTKIIRFMDALQTNSGDVDRIDIWDGPSGLPNAIISPEYIIAVCNLLNASPWITVPHLWSDDFIALFLGKLAHPTTGLNAGLSSYVEPFNEAWNGGDGFLATPFCIMRGVEMGYWNANGDATPYTLDSTINTNRFGGVHPGTGDMERTFVTGDHILQNLSGYGVRVWRANKNIVVGSADKIEPTTNAAWTMVADNNQISTAGKRYYGKRGKEIFDVAHAVWTAAGRPVSECIRTLCWAAVDPAGFKELLRFTAQTEGRFWDNLAIAPYWGGGIANWSLGEYGNDHTGWTETEKDLVATDLPAFKTAFFAAAYTCIDETYDYIADFWQDIGKWIGNNLGITPSAYTRGAYEGLNWHWITDGPWPGAMNGLIIGQLLEDARFGPLTTYALEQYAERIGGPAAAYQKASQISIDQTQNWGFMRSDLDVTSVRGLAFGAWAATL